MPLQRQTLKSSKPDISRMIAFVLPGRRTLSEHLPAEIIDVPIQLAQRSRYLRRLIVTQALNRPSEQHIRLCDVDCMGFRFYIEWLRTGHIDLHVTAASASGTGLLLRDCFDLMFAHIVGSQFEEPDFQDYIIDTMARHLNTSQTPDLKVLEEVFLEKGASNVLRQFVVDRMFAVERKMLGMIRGIVDEPENENKSGVGCEYHVHEEGRCYRTGVKNGHPNAANGTNALHTTYEDVESSTSTVQYHGVESPRSSSSTLPNTNPTNDAIPYNMSNTTYFGSAEWSREVHGIKHSTPAPDLHFDKPLPTIPPLTPGSSPNPPSSPPSLPSSLVDLSPTPYIESSGNPSKVQAVSTQQLVLECLGRLPPTNSPQIQTQEEATNTKRIPIPELVLECLKRLNHVSADNASSHTTSSIDTLSELHSPSRSSPKQSSLTLSPLTSDHYVHHERRFEELPRSAYQFSRRAHEALEMPDYGYEHSIPYPRAINEPPTHQSDHSNPHDFSPPHQLAPEAIQHRQGHEHLRPPPSTASPPPRQLIKRKPAPARGTDWLNQQNRPNPLNGYTTDITYKRSKKSRFQELLRRESGLMAMVDRAKHGG